MGEMPMYWCLMMFCYTQFHAQPNCHQRLHPATGGNWCRNPRSNIRKNSGIPSGGRIIGARRIKYTTRKHIGSTNVVHRDLQTELTIREPAWDWPRPSLCYVAWFSWRIPDSGSKECLWVFYWLLGPYSSYWVSLPNFNTRQDAESYYNLICHVLLISMGGLSFSEQKWRKTGYGQAEEKLR